MALPLKVKVAIRDLWEKPSAPVNTAISALTTLLGLELACEPEWPMLVAELGTVYPDKTDFVVAVVSSIQVWCLAMTELLEDDANEKWADTLLEKIKGGGVHRLKLYIEVARDALPSTSWDASRTSFILDLPNVQIINAPEFIPLFKGQIFDDISVKSLDDKPLRAATIVSDDWTDIDTSLGGIHDRTVPVSSSAAAALLNRSKQGNVDYLADAATLSRPDELLLRPPYHLFIYCKGAAEIEIQCSHSPSLELLAEYLKKWCRTNNSRTNKPPIVTITLHQAPFGLGSVYDTLTLFTEFHRTCPLSPTIVLSLVESVLGYERVHSEAVSWQYRKDTPLKKL